MKFKVIWSEFAENRLDDIYEYYKFNVSEKMAVNIVSDIVSSSTKLSQSPEIGQIEELLKHRNEEYRYLVSENYKIIYFIDKVNNLVKVSDVFDTRLNPTKIKRSV